MVQPLWFQYGYGLYGDWLIEVNGVGLMMEFGLTMLYNRFAVRKITSRARIRACICMCERVCAAGYMRIRGSARTCAWAHMCEYRRNPEISQGYLNIGGIFKYRSDI